MEKFLSADTDVELVKVAAQFEMILINVWACRWKLEDLPKLTCVQRNSNTEKIKNSRVKIYNENIFLVFFFHS